MGGPDSDVLGDIHLLVDGVLPEMVAAENVLVSIDEWRIQIRELTNMPFQPLQDHFPEFLA